MLKPRLIPVLLYKNGILVRSQNFNFHQSTGDPISIVERFTSWKADELIYLDIGRENAYDYHDTMQVVGSTSSKKDSESTVAKSFVEVIEAVAKTCTIPFTVGGKIKTLEDIRMRLLSGADKVSINTKALEDPDFITAAAERFGSQCIVISVDVKQDSVSKKYEVYTKFGTKPTGRDALEWCREIERRGAGEILLNSIDRDGAGNGYDLDLLKQVVKTVKIPVIALGGVGHFKHFVEGLTEGGATAVAAANIFHFTEQSIIHAKEYMREAGVDVRL